jgi:hypothetical protein
VVCEAAVVVAGVSAAGVEDAVVVFAPVEACAVERLVVTPVSGFETAVAPLLGCEVAVDAWPWNPLAANTARPPDNAAAPATMPRVTADIRRRPRSRVRTARLIAASARLGSDRRGLRTLVTCRTPP